MAQGTSLNFRERFCDKSIASLAYFLPLLEMIQAFKFSCLNTILPLDQLLLSGPLQKFLNFYATNSISLFAFLIGYFFIVRPKLTFRRFVRFNVAQALLLYLVSTLLCYSYMMVPVLIKQSILGFIIESIFYLAVVGATTYSMTSVMLGFYTDIPILSEAAEMHVPANN